MMENGPSVFPSRPFFFHACPTHSLTHQPTHPHHHHHSNHHQQGIMTVGHAEKKRKHPPPKKNQGGGGEPKPRKSGGGQKEKAEDEDPTKHGTSMAPFCVASSPPLLDRERASLSLACIHGTERLKLIHLFYHTRAKQNRGRPPLQVRVYHHGEMGGGRLRTLLRRD